MTAFLKFELENGDSKRQKVALQDVSRLYRRGYQLNAISRRSFEKTINGMVLADNDRKVVRWCLNALARLGTREGCERYVTAALRLYEEDTEIVAAAIAALAYFYRGKLDEVRGLGAFAPVIRILAAMQTSAVSRLDLSGLSIDIDKSDVEVLKLALLTVGLNKDIQHLLHPRHTNGAIVKQLGQHDDRIVRQYSVWCVMENKRLTLADLGIPFDDIDNQPPNVQAKLLQLGAEREVDAIKRHRIIHDGSFQCHPEARIGLAKGLAYAYYDGLDDITINWFDVEKERAVQGLLAEHFARFSEVSGPYSDKALDVLEADPSLLENILLGAEGKRLYGQVRGMGPQTGMQDLFGRPTDLGVMFQTSMQLTKKIRPLKILFLAASPTNQQPLRLDMEARELREQLALVVNPQATLQVEHVWAVKTDQIQREILNSRPEVLHFSGHGSHGVLAFENASGVAQEVSGQAFAELISLFPLIKCVVLNCCYSDAIAALVAPFVETVIGCDVSIDDQAATYFTRAFYRALAHGMSAHVAFRLAKNDLAIAGEKLEGEKYKLRTRSDRAG